MNTLGKQTYIFVLYVQYFGGASGDGDELVCVE